jgi:predicted TIM-barrel fold metal-dependent hydrolase
MTLPNAVDAHAHVMSKSAPLIEGCHSAPDRDVKVEDFLAMLDEYGLAYGVLTAPSFYGSDNSLLLQALGSERKRLRGTAIVEPDVAMSELQAMNDQGVVGIRLNWVRRALLPDVGTPQYQRLFEKVKELDWHIEIFLESTKLPDVLPSVRRCGVNVVLDHFALPDPGQGVRGAGFQLALNAMREGNTWVKLSAPYRLGGADPQQYVDALMEAGGPQRLMWASDWPWVQHADERTYRQCLAWLTDWVPNEATRKVVLCDTPGALFKFGFVAI